jgi:hypothetical protein
MRSRTLFVILAVSGLVTGLVACSTGHSTDMADMGHSASSAPGMAHGAEPMAMGDSLAATDQGFTFAPVSSTVGPDGFAFRILDQAGRPVTAFEPDQTKLMHFYLVRSDLADFQHVHPTMAADGTWTAPIKATAPGAYRVYASFITKGADEKSSALVLSQRVTSPGAAAPDQPLPPPSSSITVDGYTVTVYTTRLMAGHPMPLGVSISKDGQPVRDLQPYLATYAHLTAFHAGDQAMAHMHPAGPAATTDTGGPDLAFEATLPTPGDWRLFLQFQVGGVLHTAALTAKVA